MTMKFRIGERVKETDIPYRVGRTVAYDSVRLEWFVSGPYGGAWIGERDLESRVNDEFGGEGK